jgi:flagellar motor switch protein FliM
VRIQSYRFGQAERLQYGRFPALDTVFYRWARALEEVLFDAFHTEVYAGSSIVEEMRFADFHASLKHPRPIYFFELLPFQGTALLVLDNRFAALCTNPEEARKNEGHLAHLTKDNYQGLQTVVTRMMAEFDRSWEGLHPVQARLRKITPHLFRARILSGFEPCLTAQLHVSGDGISSRMMVCLPRVMLDAISPALREQAIIPSLSPVHMSADDESVLDQAPHSLTVNLGHIQSTLDADQLRVGEVFTLESVTGHQAVMEINGAPSLLGLVGEAGGRYAIQVTGAYQEQRESPVKPPEAFQEVDWPQAG